MYLHARVVSVALGIALVYSGGCRSNPTPTAAPTTQPQEATLRSYEYRQIHMGVQARLVVYAADEQTAIEACRAAYHRIAQLDDIMSDYRPASELMRLCAKAGGDPVPVSPELFLVLQKSEEMARKSNGAFDITIGPLIKLWRQARKNGQLPAEEDLRQAKALVGWNKIKLDPQNRTAQLLVPGMKLDLGGIAKGYACDEAIAVLRERGITRAVCEMGGDIVVSDPPPGKPGWVIEVTNDLPGHQSRKILVKNSGVSTSGDTEQFVIINGKRYSHIVDPRTGLGLTERSLVTIVGEKGLITDALSTAVSILGPERGRALAKSYNARAYIRLPEE
ncbi:MAG: FAD:protein FMN transferase [Bacillota bacterium]